MIRQPLQSGLARTRPDICRVTDGIASSLRQFSIAQRLSSPPSDNDSSSSSNAPSSRRQRGAAAVDELIAMGESSVNELQSRNQIQSSSSSSSSSQNQNENQSESSSTSSSSSSSSIGQHSSSSSSSFSPLARPSTIISVKSLPFKSLAQGAGIFQGVRKIDVTRGPSFGRGDTPNYRHPEAEGVHVIRLSEFRSRAVGGGAQRRGRGGGRGGRGRRRGGRGGGGEEGGGGGGKSGGRDAGSTTAWISPQERAFHASQDQGVEYAFEPSVTLDSLAGYAPAVATSSTPLARAGTVLRQARVLGGGRPYRDDEVRTPDEAADMYRRGTGVFFPTPAAREWAQRGAPKTVKFRDAPPEETRAAVLQAALLGQYDGPRFVEPRGDAVADTVAATVRNYVRRDSSWSYVGGAEEKILAKIRSLLSGGGAAGGGGAGKGGAGATRAKA